MALPDSPLPVPDHASNVNWHALSGEQAAQQLTVDIAGGLSEAEVSARRAHYGSNLMTETPGTPAWKRFLQQLAQPLVVVLIGAGCVTAALGEWTDASVIFAVVLVNAIIGYWQEAKAEGALAALARTISTPVTVRRDGHRQKLDASLLVPGDVVILAAGDRLPADLRLIQQSELLINDSMLTGESLPVSKLIAPLPADTLLAERRNMAYAGTHGGRRPGPRPGHRHRRCHRDRAHRRPDRRGAQPGTPLTRKMAGFSNWLLWASAGWRR
jgi:cation-transporting ATPase F